MSIEPIFIFSLPRSGSTLLQRILAAHERIATTAEPWLLLPLFYTRQQNGMYAEYSQRGAVKAIQDFCDAIPRGREEYDSAIRLFALHLYRRAAGNKATHFVDKTPRYALIADDIVRAFPEGKFIFIWRNPLAIAASIMRTWGRSGCWNIDQYKIDLYKGLAGLVDSYQSNSNLHAMKYERLTTQPEEELARAFSYLDLPFDSRVITSFTEVELSGQMGDPTGTNQYDKITTSATDKWKSAFRNPLRRKWAKRYLHWIGQERLAVMGYDAKKLKSDLKGQDFGFEYFFSDILYMTRGMVRPWLEPSLQRSKIRTFPDWKGIFQHS